jgi:SAM-dependent methyltransferase
LNLFYGELAEYWSLISPVEEYATEADELLRLFRERRPFARTVLELGSGGGHVAHYLARHFDCHLTDLSEAMLANSRRLNPKCAHTVGDMRTLELGRTFDVVLAHDAIDYMTTHDDLRAVFDTAWRHLAPGGLACFFPDDVADTFEPGTAVFGVDAADGRGARLFEWVEPARAEDSTVNVHCSFLIRDRDGTVRSHYERHVSGLFARATWERLLAQRGFVVEVVTEQTDEDRTPRLMFFSHKPG